MTPAPARPMSETRLKLVAVRDHEYTGASRYTGYIHKTIKLILACGHEQYRKASAGVPQKAHCRECARAQPEKR